MSGIFDFSDEPKNVFSNVVGNVGGSVIITMLVIVVLVSILGYIAYRFLVNSLKMTKLTTDVLHCRTNAKTVSASKLPTLSNGKEWGFSFWVYVEAANHTTNDKNILTFGSDSDDAPVMVVMDRNVNRMYFIFRTTAASHGDSALSALTTFRSGGEHPESHVIVPFKYVPLSRWVMLTVVVDQDMVTLYSDYYMYSTVAASRFRQGAILADPNKDILIGSSTNGADAYISKLVFFNYGISMFQVKAMYGQGPGNGGLLGMLGVSKYKLQWPITSATN